MWFRLILAGYVFHMAGSCTPPFVSVEDGCYLYSEETFVQSWDTAQQFCHMHMDASLASVKTGNLNRALIETFLYPTESVLATHILLGGTLNEAGMFEWTDGTLVRDHFTGWGENQPSGDGACMGYRRNDSFFWNDFLCDNYTQTALYVGFICEEGGVPPPDPEPECSDPFVTVDSGCYYISSTLVGYDTAMGECAALDSHLAYITSSEEQEAINNFLGADYGWAYIGAFALNGNATYYWLDGTPVESGFTNWYDNEPDGGCGYVVNLNFNGGGGQWFDDHATAYRNFLCERDI